MLELWVAGFIFIALLVGWFSGRRAYRHQHRESTKLSAEYYKGINYLLNEKPDKALEVFLRLVEVDGETVETHVTLGKLFRRKGEIENAIRIHQNLIARPNISREDRSLALLELGKDYRAAGVLDRAEGLFQEVCEEGVHRRQAQRALRDIYVQEQEWLSAIDVLKAYIRTTGDKQNKLIAHYYCEQADLDQKQGHEDIAGKYLQQAYQHDKESLRVNYMLAEQDFTQQRYLEALAYYVRVIELDTRFATKALPKIQQCLEQVDNKRVQRQLDALFARLKKEGVYVTPLTQQIRDREGVQEAKAYLEGIMDTQPGVEPLKDWLELHPVSIDAKSIEKQINKLEVLNHDYQCEHCGYNSRNIQWHCPSCAHWGSIFPVYR